MSLDHAEFIARYHKSRYVERNIKNVRRDMMLSLALIFVYLGVCVLLAIVFNINQVVLIAAGLLFIITAFLGFFVQRFIHTYGSQEKERQLLKEVLEGSRGARLITDSADNTVYTNQNFDSLCEGVGESGIESLAGLFINNKEAHAHFRLLAEQAGRGLKDSVELQSILNDRERWFIVTAQPIAGWAGFVHWRVDDITDQREVDRSIREEREKLIDFTDNAPVGFFSVDETGSFVFVNATLARWLGSDIGRLLQTGKLHTYLERPPENAAAYDVIENGGARQVAEIVMKGPAGKTFLTSVNQAVVHEAGGRVRTRGVVHDLTVEREMHQALQASEDRFQRFFEEAPLGIALVNSKGVVENCNFILAGLLKQDPKDVEGKKLEGFISTDDRSAVFAALDKIKQGQQTGAPLEISLHTQKNVVVQLFARKMKGSHNIVLHFLDLTEQKSLEEQFVQSQKMQAIGQLAGGVAHDFNNLLTAIIGFCDLLLLRHKPGDPSFGDIMQIKQNSNRASNLVRQLLAFSRQQTLRPKVQDVTDILTEVSHLLRRLIGANIDLDLVHGQGLGLVKVDVGQMEQVLINLAVNARDAMDGGGKLIIKTENFSNEAPLKRGDDEMPAGQWVMIAVTDTGTGIDPDNLSRIFEPFFTTKDVGQGTGLGLATVYGIVRQTGGYLHVDSTLGEGTCFSLYLPSLSDQEIQQETENEPSDDDTVTGDLTGTACILLVEDEDAVRTFGSRALANKGYDVVEAENGEAALNVLKSLDNKQIDLLITDVMMPNMDGPTLAGHMRENSPNLKIIFISGYTEDKLKDHMGDGIFFLPKPFTLKQLAAKVKEVLDD